MIVHFFKPFLAISVFFLPARMIVRTVIATFNNTKQD